MNLAWWPQTADTRVASARLRCFRIVEHLRGLGMAARVYEPGSAAPDVLVLSKRYDAESLSHATALRARAGTALVLDLCDNHFYFESDPDGRLQRRADALRRAAANVQLVVTASQALADIVQDQAPGARAVKVVEDAVEPPHAPSGWERLANWRAHRELRALSRWLAAHPDVSAASRCIWFGNHGSPGVDGGLADLRRIRGDMEQAARQHGPLSLTVISNNPAKFADVTLGWSLPTHYMPWHPSTFSLAMMMHGMAMIPINVNPFTLCKTANRVLTAFQHGLAVVGDSIPSYAEFRDCAVLDNWDAGLGSYRLDAPSRQADIIQGRAIASGRFGLDAIAGQWLAVLGALHPAAASTSPRSPAP